MNEALRQDELLAKAYLYKGLNYAEMKDTGNAISNLQTVTSLNPKSYQAHLHLGNLHADDPQQAIDYYSNAIRLKPHKPAARYGRGYTYQTLGAYQKAKKDYKAILKRKPMHKQANYNLGYLHYLDSNYQKARAQFKNVLLQDSTHVHAHLGQGLVYQKLDNKQKAMKHLRRVIDLSPQNRLARRKLKALKE